MALYVLSDLHLGFSTHKSMDRFGENWRNHTEKIESNWIRTLKHNDTILLPGDLSWSLHIEDAMADLQFVDRLPGYKILFQGNHDFWWSSTDKLNRLFPSMQFIKTGILAYKDWMICATKGYNIPGNEWTAQDAKLYKREALRFERALSEARFLGTQNLIGALHYPPCYKENTASVYMDLIQAYGVSFCVYGHLHGEAAFESGIDGLFNGCQYILASSDYLDFTPRLIPLGL